MAINKTHLESFTVSIYKYTTASKVFSDCIIGLLTMCCSFLCSRFMEHTVVNEEPLIGCERKILCLDWSRDVSVNGRCQYTSVVTY